MNIKKGDNVIMTSGKDSGKKGKVLKAMPKEGVLIVEGVNIKNKRQRPRKANEKGQTIKKSAPVNVSSVALFCSSCGKGVRLKSALVKGKKVRVCAKCGKEV